MHPSGLVGSPWPPLDHGKSIIKSQPKLTFLQEQHSNPMISLSQKIQTVLLDHKEKRYDENETPFQENQARQLFPQDHLWLLRQWVLQLSGNFNAGASQEGPRKREQRVFPLKSEEVRPYISLSEILWGEHENKVCSTSPKIWCWTLCCWSNQQVSFPQQHFLRNENSISALYTVYGASIQSCCSNYRRDSLKNAVHCKSKLALHRIHRAFPWLWNGC